MLSISVPMKSVSGAVDYYLSFTTDDYYANRNEEPGRWYGLACENLKLRGSVEKEDFRHLLNGFSRDGKTKYVQNAGTSHRAKHGRQNGWDLTLSAPKAASVLWASSTDEFKKLIEAAHDHAVNAALDYIQDTAAVTRTGAQGKITEAVTLAFAIFKHGASRANEPQLHSHAVLINLGVKDDGTTGALRSIDFFRHKMAAGAVYQADFASGLREIGLTIEPERVGFHIKGVPKDLCGEWSSRGKEIRQEMNSRGTTGAVAAKIAAFETRPEKQHIPSRDLTPYWQTVSAAFGLSQEKAAALFHPQTEHTQKDIKPFEQALKRVFEKTPAENQTAAAFTTKAAKIAVEHNVDSQTLRRSIDKTLCEAGENLFRVEWKKHFRSAPNWSPVKDLEIPRLGVIHKKVPEKWQDVVWTKNLIIAEIRFQKRLLFPNAPAWNPAAKIAISLPRLIAKGPTGEGDVTIATKSLGPLELRLLKKQLFPKAPSWSPASKIKIPFLQLAPKPPKSQSSKHKENIGNSHSY